MNFVRNHPNLCIMLGFIFCYMLGCGSAHYVPANNVQAQTRTHYINPVEPFSSLQAKDTIKHVIVDPAALKPVLSMANRNSDDLSDIKKVLAGMDRQDKANAEVKTFMSQLLKENERLQAEKNTDKQKYQQDIGKVIHKLDSVKSLVKISNYRAAKSEEMRRRDARLNDARWDALSNTQKFGRFVPIILLLIAAGMLYLIVKQQGDSVFNVSLFKKSHSLSKS